MANSASRGKTTVVVRNPTALARQVLESRGYQRTLARRLIAGRVSPAEVVMWVYAWGLPPEVMRLLAQVGARE